jgi:hypothetical protein
MSKTRSNTPRADRKQDRLANNLSQAISRALTEGQLQALDAASHTDFAALIVERARAPRAPAWMANAQSADPAVREQTRESYERCLDIYRTVVRPQDTTYDDAGAAAAFFVAVNLNALHDVETTPETLLLLERQLLGLVRQGAQWDSASLSERQFYFEQMAMLGAFMAGLMEKARSEGPAALAKVQNAARGYLRRVLGMEPDLLTFGAHGLALRSAAGEAPSTA